jgi:hypothetical protein
LERYVDAFPTAGVYRVLHLDGLPVNPPRSRSMGGPDLGDRPWRVRSQSERMGLDHGPRLARAARIAGARCSRAHRLE